MSEPDVEFGGHFIDAMRRLYDVCAESSRALRELSQRMFLLAHPELEDWNDEMDNTYPNWP